MAEASGPDRNARRRMRTRARLLDAAYVVMAEQGVEGATIQAITDLADVGFGTFYNHFDSKESLLDAVVADTIEPWTRALGAMALGTRDSAQDLAASLRLTLRRALAEPRWGWFVFRTGPWIMRSHHRLDRHLTQVIQRGLAAGRFHAEDPDVVITAVGGVLLAVLHGMLEGNLGDDAPERAAGLCLRLLGVGAEEAAVIAGQQLPILPVMTGA